MNRDCKNALARIAKLCRENIAAFGPTYDPRTRPWQTQSAPMKGAKAEGNGVTDMATEILTEIRLIRREHRRSSAEAHGRAVARTVQPLVGSSGVSE
jgi:hypothetical protein